METSNPALRSRALRELAGRIPGEAAMTVSGTATKTIVLLLATAFSAIMVWRAGPSVYGPSMLIGIIGGLILAMATAFKPMWAPVTAPIYAVVEGLALGAISAIYQTQLAGLPMLAVAATMSTAIVMFLVYRAGLIKVTARMRSVATMALLGVMATYLLQFILGFFGMSIPFINGNGAIGIAVSAFTTGLAAFFLLLDMDQVERMAAAGLPKSAEWYGAFSFLVTLVWLYLEMLRLLAKLQRR